MKLDESMRIVLELARQNTLTEEDVVGDPDLEEERQRQLQAIADVEYNYS